MNNYEVLGFYAIAFIVVWVLALLFKDRLKIDVEGPILMRRTTRLRDFIDSIAQKSPKFWKYAMNVGIPVAVFFMGLIIYLLLDSLIASVTAPAASTQPSGVSIAIPGFKIPGGIDIPLSYGLIALVTVIVVHEFAHGILARAEGIKIKSIGLLLLAILPGAFVEPDEEQIKKAKRVSKLRIYAAGSIFNIGFAALAFVGAILLSMFFIGPSFHSESMQITSVMPKSPADGVLKEGMMITSINGKEITNRTSFTNTLNATKPGDTETITTNQGTFTIKTAPNPRNSSASYVGIVTQENLVVNKDVSSVYGDTLPWILFSFAVLLQWIFILNFGIGTFNLLPLKPLDGGLMLEELLNYITSSEVAKVLTNSVSLFSLALVIASISYSLVSAIT